MVGNMFQGVMSRELELQNMLADERLRCDQHKINYQTLKDEHTRLQEELLSVQQQLKQVTEQKKEIQQANEAYVEKLQNLILTKQKEIDGYKEKIEAYNPEEIKRKLLEEIELHYKESSQQLEADVDRYREQYNRLHYDHTVIKCQIQYLETEHSRTLEEINLKHQAEIEKLQAEIETLQEQKSVAGQDCSIQLRAAQRENSQLNLKIKALLAECEELRALKERSALQVDNIARVQSKQLAEHAANIRTLESEKTKALMEKEVVQKELSSCLEHQKTLASQLQATKDQVLMLQSQVEECEHKYQLKITDIQIEAVKKEAELGGEKDRLADELQKMKLEVKILEDDASKQKQIFVEKERSIQMQIQSENQLVWQQYYTVDRERGKLEYKMKELERSKTEVITKLQHELQLLKHKLQDATEAKTATEKELLILKVKFDEINKIYDEKHYADLLKENSSLKSEVQNLQKRVSQLVANQDEFADQSTKLKEVASVHRKLEDRAADLEHQELLQHRLNWEQQKLQFQQRVEDLERQLREKNSTFMMEKKDTQNKVKQYSRLISKLREKLEIQKAHVEELKTEKEVLKKNIPPEVHTEVKKQLLELQRKHEEFHQIMLAAVHYMPGKHQEIFSTSSLFHSDQKPFTSLPLQTTVNAEEFHYLKRRLDQLDKKYSGDKKIVQHPKRPIKPKGSNRSSKAYGNSSSSSASENL